VWTHHEAIPPVDHPAKIDVLLVFFFGEAEPVRLQPSVFLVEIRAK
jgi:hypothetical protein